MYLPEPRRAWVMLDQLAGYFFRLSTQLENATEVRVNIQFESKDDGEKCKGTKGDNSQDQTDKGNLRLISHVSNGSYEYDLPNVRYQPLTLLLQSYHLHWLVGRR